MKVCSLSCQFCYIYENGKYCVQWQRKKLYVTILISLLKFLWKFPKLSGAIECQLLAFKSGREVRPNWVFVDRRGRAGVRTLDFFADLINKGPLTKLFFATENDFLFFFPSFLSASENKFKNTFHTGQFHLDIRRTN